MISKNFVGKILKKWHTLAIFSKKLEIVYFEGVFGYFGALKGSCGVTDA